MSPKLVVVIDDLRSLRQERPDTTVVYLRTCDQALTYLVKAHADDTVIDELWCDHDLGDGRDIPPVIYQLKEWFFNGQPLSVLRAFVQSSNTAAGRVAEDLRWCGYPTQRLTNAEVEQTFTNPGIPVS